jgi:Multisubunit Na+/H+ antiporter, MnhB subunit
VSDHSPQADGADSTATRGATSDSLPTGDDSPSSVEGQRPPYTESQVITATVQLVTPFALTYGLFVTFHGADSAGGGFQGGAIAAAVVFMIAFAYGIEATRDWLSNSVIVGLAAGGVIVFAGIGLAGVGLGGSFLEYGDFPIKDSVKYGVEAVEIGGIAAIVSGILVGLFFVLAAGFAVTPSDTAGSESPAQETTVETAEVDP